ncbi:MAG TPA: tripartite tricarboxylate transporter substrate-binding protein [Kiloniellales bacterium]|nr:tripartite tricarboxylate transporter substrate-binding protein [Kiloniellales bacterium]
MLRRLTIALAAIAGALGVGASAQANEFFEGKTITYIVATNPGGGYDTYGRLIAKYMEKHLPVGNIVVKNVPGAGHIIGANTIFAAEPDGLTIGTFNTGLIYAQILEREGIKFDLREMSWIGKAASDTRVLMLGKESGFSSFEEFANAEEPQKMAVSGVGSAAYNELKLLQEALDLNIELVPGFRGNEGEMSILRGEVAGTIGSKSSLQPFVDNGHGIFVLEVGGPSDSPIPQARNYAETDEARSIIALIASQGSLGRLTAGPPGIPEDRLAALREAYRTSVTDPDLLAEAEKLGRPIEPAVGEDVAQAVNAALNQSPETVELIAAVMNIEVPTVTVQTDLLSVSDDGRWIEFKSGEETVKSKVSGSRTAVMIGGADANRKQLEAGMSCTIEYAPGGDNEPKSLDCGTATN